MRKPLELLAFWLLLAPLAVPAVTVTPEELNQARQWAGIRFTNAAPSRSEAPGLAGPPFSFVYGGRPSADEAFVDPLFD